MKELSGTAVNTDIETVSDLGEEVVEILASDKQADNQQVKDSVERAVESRKGRIYHDLIFTLAQLDMPEEKARDAWESILKHKYWMSEQLGRNAGIRVATLDYFYNVTKELKYVTMMDVYKYGQTRKNEVTDWLTGIFLKQHFYTLLDDEISRSKRMNQKCSIFFLDIDHFKIYNDTHGHLAGDALLRELVEIIRSIVRRYDVFARYGGEEFIILFPSTGKSAAREIADDIRQTIEDYPFSGEMILPGQALTISGGISEYPTDGADSQLLLKSADDALYKSKQSGRNRITVC